MLDKPLGISSNAALQKVKGIYRAQKAGHTGSLDPLATGMLPVCLGEATKVSAYLLDADKYYLARCKLGVTTTTGDSEGEVVAQYPVGEISEERLQAVIASFIGEIEQIPPMHSALKRDGVPLYKLAHQGIEIEREPRQVVIHALTARRVEETVLELSVHCSKGTYIRTLAEDIGKALGCGAHLIGLRREWVGGFERRPMHTLAELQEVAAQGLEALDRLLLPMDTPLTAMPTVELTDDAAFYIQRGQFVFVPQAPAAGLVRLYAGEKRFLGVGEVRDDGKIAPRRLVNIQ
ncbi:MAG: tRNA pseudouridine(55) synthase TruB [Pseudomonadota bacterium]